MNTQSQTPEPAPDGLPPHHDDVDADVDNDPGNEDPGSQFDRDATVPLIDPDE